MDSIFNQCSKLMIRFKIIPDFRSFPFKRVNIDFFEDLEKHNDLKLLINK